MFRLYTQLMDPKNHLYRLPTLVLVMTNRVSLVCTAVRMTRLITNMNPRSETNLAADRRTTHCGSASWTLGWLWTRQTNSINCVFLHFPERYGHLLHQKLSIFWSRPARTADTTAIQCACRSISPQQTLSMQTF